MVDLVKLRELATAATPLDLSSAQKVGDGYEISCPVCDGEGEIPAKDWCNIDGQAIGVQVYGIGEKMTAMERFIDAANPATVLDLIAEIERLRAALTLAANRLDRLTLECDMESGIYYAAQDWTKEARALGEKE